MKMLQKALLAASALALAPIAPAAAQTVAYTDVQQILGTSQAARTADQQMRVTYKANYDQIESRSRVLQAELNALVVKFQAEQPDARHPSEGHSGQAAGRARRTDQAQRTD